MSTTAASSVGKNARFARLMHLFTEHYRRLTLLVDADHIEQRRYISRAGASPDLYVELMEQHRYTTVLRMTYWLDDNGSRSLDPDAEVRLYHDAQVAEAVHVYPGRLLRPMAGPYWPPAAQLRHRWRMNLFFDKWLDYLLSQGHGLGTLEPVRARDWPLPPYVPAQQVTPASLNGVENVDSGLLDSSGPVA